MTSSVTSHVMNCLYGRENGRMLGTPRSTGTSGPWTSQSQRSLRRAGMGPLCPTDGVGLGDMALLMVSVVNELTLGRPAGLLLASCQPLGL